MYPLTALQMKGKHCTPLFHMMSDALLGAVVGLLSGFLLGWLIYGISWIFYPPEVISSIYYSAPFLGMGFGTFLGAILGGVVGIKKMK